MGVPEILNSALPYYLIQYHKKNKIILRQKPDLFFFQYEKLATNLAFNLQFLQTYTKTYQLCNSCCLLGIVIQLLVGRWLGWIIKYYVIPLYGQ